MRREEEEWIKMRQEKEKRKRGRGRNIRGGGKYEKEGEERGEED